MEDSPLAQCSTVRSDRIKGGGRVICQMCLASVRSWRNKYMNTGERRFQDAGAAGRALTNIKPVACNTDLLYPTTFCRGAHAES